VVGDPAGALAAQFGLDRTSDGGAPVGYAVVDGHGDIRYRTLDPSVASQLDEIDTILRAAR
jgi:alkyl hydroperoxide reductase subunit AhpC